MFPACWNFLKDVFTKIVNPMYSAKIDGIPLFTLAFYVFFASLLVRFVFPLLSIRPTSSLVPTVSRKWSDTQDSLSRASSGKVKISSSKGKNK